MVTDMAEVTDEDVVALLGSRSGTELALGGGPTGERTGCRFAVPVGGAC